MLQVNVSCVAMKIDLTIQGGQREEGYQKLTRAGPFLREVADPSLANKKKPLLY